MADEKKEPDEEGFEEEWDGEEGAADRKGGGEEGAGGKKEGGEAAGEKKEGTIDLNAPPAGEEAPAAASGPQSVPQTKEIEAPEVLPSVEQVGARTTLLAKGQAVLPDEGGVPLVTGPVSIEWAKETPATGPTGKGAAKAEAPAEVGAGEPERAGPMYPYFQPLPAHFRGMLADIQRFIGAGELLLLAGGLAFFIFSLANIGTAVADSRQPWTAPHVPEDIVWAVLALLLSAGSFLSLLLSRRKLRGAFFRNDFPALGRRLVPACAAGLVLGLFVGGVFFFLAYIKVDELPVVGESKATTGEPASR
jgi:hypothetical protein